MNFFDIFPILLAVVLVFLMGWLLPKAGTSYDVFRLKLQLFPNWLKYISAFWILSTLLLVFLLQFPGIESQIYFLTVNLNFAFFIFFFTKDKSEDEFSEQLRLKAFIYAFVLFVPVLLIFGALKGSSLILPAIFQEYTFVQFYLGIALLTALVYFYISKYKSGKNENIV